MIVIVMMHKLKNIVLSLLAFILSGVFVFRLIHAATLPEALFGVYVTLLFGCYGLYGLFENQIKGMALYRKHERWIHQNRIVLDQTFLLINIVLFGILLLSYPQEGKFLSKLATFMSIFFFVGGLILCIRIAAHLRGRRNPSQS